PPRRGHAAGLVDTQSTPSQPHQYRTSGPTGGQVDRFDPVTTTAAPPFPYRSRYGMSGPTLDVGMIRAMHLPKLLRLTWVRRSAWPVVLLALLAGLAGPAALARGAPSHQLPPNAFLETFDGRPEAPTPWHGTGWDVTVHSRNRETWQQLEPMAAMHGADCSA